MNRTFSFGLALAISFFLLVGCASNRPLPTVPSVDLQRYSGRWYEAARLRNRFQADNEGAIAEYRPLSPSTVAVKNTALKPNGETRSITGVAEVVPNSRGARLRVKFNGPAGLIPVSDSGNYWIIALDANYHTAMVGTPDRKFLWILSRSRTADAKTVASDLTLATKLGFPIDRLIGR